jgi:hypothetical protein
MGGKRSKVMLGHICALLGGCVWGGRLVYQRACRMPYQRQSSSQAPHETPLATPSLHTDRRLAQAATEYKKPCGAEAAGGKPGQIKYWVNLDVEAVPVAHAAPFALLQLASDCPDAASCLPAPCVFVRARHVCV